MNNLRKWDPFTELTSLQRQFFGDDWATPLRGVNIPTTDVFTKDNNMVVEAHLPNFEEDDINIEVDNNTLVVSAERHEKEEDKDKQYVVRESSSSFYRQISLPKNADSGKIEANLDDGILRVSVPLSAPSDAKKISISPKKK